MKIEMSIAPDELNMEQSSFDLFIIKLLQTAVIVGCLSEVN